MLPREPTADGLLGQAADNPGRATALLQHIEVLLRENR